jgi:hypothetical protein
MSTDEDNEDKASPNLKTVTDDEWRQAHEECPPLLDPDNPEDALRIADQDDWVWEPTTPAERLHPDRHVSSIRDLEGFSADDN